MYYRLNGFQLNIPPLRNRIEDVEVLTKYLVEKYVSESGRNILGISPGVMEKFCCHSWPGNVRELENEIKRMIAITENNAFITEESLSPHIAVLEPDMSIEQHDTYLDGMTLKQKVEQMEARIIEQTLKRLRWNRSRAAAELGLSRVGLSNKIKRYNIGTESAVA